MDYSDLYDALAFFRGGFDAGAGGGESDAGGDDAATRGMGGRAKAVPCRDGEDGLAREIASAGREWSRTFWRKEDMTAYFWRLILEIARLSGERDGRDDLDM